MITCISYLDNCNYWKIISWTLRPDHWFIISDTTQFQSRKFQQVHYIMCKNIGQTVNYKVNIAFWTTSLIQIQSKSETIILAKALLDFLVSKSHPFFFFFSRMQTYHLNKNKIFPVSFFPSLSHVTLVWRLLFCLHVLLEGFYFLGNVGYLGY